ncbi:hypothetical protein LDO48_20025 [Pantoea agglomerans]|nr:hypothetical protein [Pantoea agglomerans]
MPLILLEFIKLKQLMPHIYVWGGFIDSAQFYMVLRGSSGAIFLLQLRRTAKIISNQLSKGCLLWQKKKVKAEDFFTESATAADLRAAAMKDVLSNYVHVDDTGMARELFAAAERAFTVGDFPASRGLRLLGAICMLHMRSDDPADTWHPRWTDGDVRDLTPADVRGEQNTALSECIVEITHPALRARVADVVWSNDRKEYKAANEAIKAYCECADGLISGILEEKDKGHKLSLF